MDAGLGGKMGLHCVHLYTVADFDVIDYAIRTVLDPSQNQGDPPKCLHDWPPLFLLERQRQPLTNGTASATPSGEAK